MRWGLVIGLVVMAAAGCGSSSKPKPISRSGSAELHRLLERGISAEHTAGSGILRMSETVTAPGHLEQIAETTQWRLHPRESRALSVTDTDGKRVTAFVLQVGAVDYLSGDAVAKLIPAGKMWLRVPAARLNNAVGVPQQASQLIDELQAASKVTRVGATTMRGQRATEYRFLLDISRLSAKATRTSMLGRFGTLLEGVQIPTELWVSARGLPVREHERYQLKGVTFTIDAVFAFGVPVHVAAPPADEVGSPAGSSGSPAA